MALGRCREKGVSTAFSIFFLGQAKIIKKPVFWPRKPVFPFAKPQKPLDKPEKPFDIRNISLAEREISFAKRKISLAKDKLSFAKEKPSFAERKRAFAKPEEPLDKCQKPFDKRAQMGWNSNSRKLWNWVIQNVTEVSSPRRVLRDCSAVFPLASWNLVFWLVAYG